MSNPLIQAAYDVPLRGGGNYGQKVLAIPNVIAYWPLTETSGSGAAELSGQAADGTAYGVTWADTPGAGSSMGRAPYFDGNTDYVDVFSAALAANVDTDGELTVSLWVKYAAAIWTEDVDRCAVSLFNAGQRQEIWKAGASEGYDLMALYASGSNKSKIDTTSTAWLHVAATYDGSQVTIYGNAAGQTPAAYTAADYTISIAQLGKYGGPGSYYHKGHLAHVAIYGRALTQAEITTLATAE